MNMSQKFFVMLDRKVGVYRQPFPAVNVQAAVRSLTTAVNDKDTEIGLYPEDFDLYQINEFDADKGIFCECEKPVYVCNAMSLKKKIIEEEEENANNEKKS